jgi:hypothetical protein
MVSVTGLEQAERALAQHQLSAPAQIAIGGQLLQPVPDAAAQTELRIALAEATRSEAALAVLNRLPRAIALARRAAGNKLAETALADEIVARRVRPLLGAVIDEASQQGTALASERAEKAKRIADMQDAIKQQKDEIRQLLSEAMCLHTMKSGRPGSTGKAAGRWSGPGISSLQPVCRMWQSLPNSPRACPCLKVTSAQSIKPTG